MFQIAAPDASLNAANQENLVYYIKKNQTINQQTKKLDDRPIEIFECQLVNTQSYVEAFEIRPITLQKKTVELVIKTQLLSAKDPSEWRIKSRTCVDIDSLKKLQKIISSYLKNQTSSHLDLQ